MTIRFQTTDSLPSEVRFGVYPMRLGWVAVGETSLGVCAVAVTATELEGCRVLEEMIPRGKLVRVGQSKAAEQIRAYLEGQLRGFELTVDVVATPFQRAVWQALCEIPYGETTTYSALAERLGRPQAVRAVARACASNPVALVVPCHRVVRTDGQLAGFRWGIACKRSLLELEEGIS